MTVQKPVHLGNGVYWVGCGINSGELHCNPYLIVDGEEAVLIDPGSALDFEYVYENVCSIVPLEQIKYVILHHQDPDLCAAVPLFEQKGGKFKIVTHWRTKTIIKYYGIKSEYYLVSKNGFQLVFKSGRHLAFIQTPYLHFPGSITTYDYQSKILFSSDLFGAFSKEWSLFVDNEHDYIERMKTFHEHYMPTNDILRPAMEIFLSMDIAMIASQHGSIIKGNVRKFIEELRNLQCGSFLKPIQKNLFEAGGYRFVCSAIIGRFASIYGKEEVLEVFQGLDITFTEELEILDFNYTGQALWELIFERVLSRKGVIWLLTVEPYVKLLAKEYDIPVPQAYLSSLKKYEETALKLSKENEMLREINDHLEKGLNEAKNKLSLDPLTGIYNFEFFRSYLISETKSILEEDSNQNPGLILISPDNIGRIRYKYGEKELDETLKNIVYLLEANRNGADQLFRMKGAQFAYFVNHTTLSEAEAFAEVIRNEIAASNKFIEPITASIGIAVLDEVKNQYQEEIDDKFYELALGRLTHAKRNGKNMVFAGTIDEMDKDDQDKILLVDTDRVNIDVLKTFLESNGYPIVFATDGEEALHVVETYPIKLIISEIMLPKQDGFLLRERLLAGSHTKNIPLIYVSYMKDDHSVQRAAALGVEHYFKKPYMLSELIGVIHIKFKGDA